MALRALDSPFLLLTTAIIASSIRFCSSTVLLLLLFEPVAKFNPSTIIHTMRHTQQRRLSACGCEQQLMSSCCCRLFLVTPRVKFNAAPPNYLKPY